MQKLNKQQYQKYRQILLHKKVESYIDQNNNTYTTCTECLKKDCKMSIGNVGCMDGETKPDVLVKINRG